MVHEETSLVATQLSCPLEEAEFIQRMTQNQQAIYHLIVLALLDPHDADEVYQQTNLVLWKKRLEYDPQRGAFAAWAAGIARLQTRSFQRQHRRTRFYLTDKALSLLVESEPEACDSLAQRQAAALENCLQKLAPEQHSLVEAYYLDGGSAKAAAQSRRSSVSAIHTQLHRIRTRLLACIQRTLAAEEYS